MFKNFSFKIKLIILSSIPLLALIIMLTMLLSELKKTTLGVERIYSDRVVPLEDLKSIADDYAVNIVDAVNKANSGLATAENTALLIEKSEDSIAKSWEKYMSTEHTAQEAKLSEEAEVLFITADTALEGVLSELKSLSGNIQGKLNHINGHLYDDIDPISEKLAELINLQLRVAGLERDKIISDYERDVVVISSLAALIILISTSLSVLIYQSLASPLHNIKNTVEKITSESNLTHVIQIEGKNEFSEIADSLNTLFQQMRALIQQVSNSTVQLASSAQNMTTVSQNSSKSINTQRDEIQQVATAVNELVSTAQEVSRNAEIADNGAKDTSTQAEQGSSIVNRAVDATKSLVTDVEKVSDHMLKLEKDSENIGSIVDVIKGIAEQTNLLALNAAIEAARAGDQGRGFAVVADEVRTLAQRTQVSTQEIQAAIESLQKGTNNAATSMQIGQQKASDTGAIAEQAGAALNTISVAVEEIKSMNALIATASEEQTIVSEEINKSLTTLHDTSAESSKDADKINVASTELQTLSEDLKLLVSKYTVNS